LVLVAVAQINKLEVMAVVEDLLEAEDFPEAVAVVHYLAVALVV
jgi:hypothetical protein